MEVRQKFLNDFVSFIRPEEREFLLTCSDVEFIEKSNELSYWAGKASWYKLANEVDIYKVLDFINSKTEAVKEWEESCIAVYRTLRGLRNVLESAIKEIESDVVDQVQAYPKEYLDFRLSTRTTYQYNTSPLYIEKSKELKDIETLLKQATENKMKGIGYTTDADGMIIDPVEVKYTQVLTYSPKWV